MTCGAINLFDRHDTDNAMDRWCRGWWQRPSVVVGGGGVVGGVGGGGSGGGGGGGVGVFGGGRVGVR